MKVRGGVEERERDVLDPMTGIPSKDSFYKNVRRLLDENPDKEFDFITSDIEHFRVINDLHGYEMGDELLRYSAQKVEEVCRHANGICGRYFADIFMSVVPHQEGLVEKIVDMTAKSIGEGPVQPGPNMRFGIYPIKDRDLPISAMYDRSMLALSSIRGRTPFNYAVFEEKQRESILKEQMILRSIDDAMRNGEVTIHLQPKYRLVTRRISGAEALVRWNRPHEGFLPPAEFIPILEQKGQIFKLDLFVWELTCQLLRRWIDNDMPIVPVSVNVSRVDLDDPLFEHKFMELIDTYQIPARYFILEITETTYANLDKNHIATIEKLRRQGFKVEMDDFGSGYSSLTMLKDFYIDDLKIDLGFITGIGENTRGEKILQLVVDLANDLELGVIAEGVEKANQADFLLEIGCQIAQGFYFARPMPESDFEKLLTRDT